jgi:Flp pilus assembly protein TadD
MVDAQKLPEAREQFKRALELDPKYADARYNLASVEATSGQWEAAANDFKQVLTQRPDNAKARQHLGEVLFLWGDDLAQSGNQEQAVLHYRESLVYRPDDAELHTSLGAALARLGQVNEAQSEFEAAVRIDPNFEPAKQALAAIQHR